jgi:hypothetical protein
VALTSCVHQKSFAPSLKLVPSLKLLAARDRRKRCVFVVKNVRDLPLLSYGGSKKAFPLLKFSLQLFVFIQGIVFLCKFNTVHEKSLGCQ